MGSTTLWERFGGGVDDPTDGALVEALREVYVEDNPACVEGDYEEHPNAWLTYSYEVDGQNLSVCLDVYRTGMIIFSKTSEEDGVMPDFEKIMYDVSFDKALFLWRRLSLGDVASLHEENWEDR